MVYMNQHLGYAVSGIISWESSFSCFLQHNGIQIHAYLSDGLASRISWCRRLHDAPSMPQAERSCAIFGPTDLRCFSVMTSMEKLMKSLPVQVVRLQDLFVNFWPTLPQFVSMILLPWSKRADLGSNMKLGAICPPSIYWKIDSGLKGKKTGNFDSCFFFEIWMPYQEFVIWKNVFLKLCLPPLLKNVAPHPRQDPW